MTEVYPDIYGDLYSSFPVMGLWSDAYAESAQIPPVPGTASLEVPVANTAGDWMVAVVGWRCPPGYPPPTFSVGDDVHNWWDPLVQDAGSVSSPSGLTRCSVWIAPSARAATMVMAAPSGYSPAYAMTVYDITGMLPWVSTTAATAFANDADSLACNLGSPPAQSIIFAVSASDNVSDPPALTGSGWASPAFAEAANGTDSTSDIVLASSWQVTSGSVSASWSAGSDVNLSAVTAGPVIAAEALGSLNPSWPVVIYETAPGGGFQVPPDELTWTSLAGQTLSMEPTQGRQYETDELATGEGTTYLDNPLGNLVPPGTGQLAGIDSGTPIRVRAAWQGGAWQMSFHGNGTTANPQAGTNRIFSVLPEQPYSSSAWLACSVPYPAGVAWVLAFYDAHGTLQSAPSSALVTGTEATLATISGTAPANAAYAALYAQAAGIPPSSVIFSASAAPPVA